MVKKQRFRGKKKKVLRDWLLGQRGRTLTVLDIVREFSGGVCKATARVVLRLMRDAGDVEKVGYGQSTAWLVLLSSPSSPPSMRQAAGWPSLVRWRALEDTDGVTADSLYFISTGECDAKS